MRKEIEMKKILTNALRSLMIVPLLALGASFFVATPAYAESCFTNTGIGGGAGFSKTENLANDLFTDDGLFKKVTDILLFLVGAISVIMLIIGGIRYVVSGGDQGAVTSAKNTILYAIVGIIVAFLAFAAINFVMDGLAPAGS